MSIQRKDLTGYLFNILAIGQTYDSVLNAITEEELEVILKMKCSLLGHQYPIIPTEDVPLLICLARKEVYWKMATASAPLYKLNLEDLSVDKNVRFDHYLKLIQQVDKEYEQLLKDPNRVKISVGDIIIDKPYTYAKRMENYVAPTTIINIDGATTNSFEIALQYMNLKARDYKETIVYVCTEPIWDKYEETINPLAKQGLVIKNSTKSFFRLRDLEPNTHYYILVEVILHNGVKTYTEIEGDTLNA